MDKETIKQLALVSGFKLKQQPNGDMELNPYVYEFAVALSELSGRDGFIAGYECCVERGEYHRLEDFADEYVEKSGKAVRHD